MKKGLVIGMGVVLVLAIVFVAMFNSNATGNYIKLEPTGNVAGTGLTVTENLEETGETKEFTMTASDFAWNPSTIEVNEGDRVILYITSTDVDHGIAIPQFGVSQDLPLNVETTVEFIADMKGTYTMYCNVYCGSGHRDMKGTLIVN